MTSTRTSGTRSAKNLTLITFIFHQFMPAEVLVPSAVYEECDNVSSRGADPSIVSQSVCPGIQPSFYIRTPYNFRSFLSEVLAFPKREDCEGKVRDKLKVQTATNTKGCLIMRGKC